MININKAIQFKDSFNLGIITRYGELITGFYTAYILIKKGNAKRAIIILQSEIKELRALKNNTLLISELSLLAEAYTANGNTQEAYKTLKEAFLLKEKLVAEQNDNRSLNFESEQKMQESENAIVLLNAKNKANQKIKYYLFIIVGLLALFVIGLAVFYSNKRKSSRQLALKNERLAYTIQKLESSQSQLIQSEKMASLGELTAGIAHEIQNPLNFVNNFSDVSNELIEEMNQELDKGDITEAKAIAADVKQNLEKINHHGKRASSIVKGMLEHSRKSSGTKEPTDINALADEYLKLAYQSLRAKDKNFNATLETHFDPNLPKIEIVTQDIGRVLLNLITNAFYAVNERSKNAERADSPLGAGGKDGKKTEPDYIPTVTITTQLTPKTQPPNSLINQQTNSPTSQQANMLIIAIKDNGLGIPDGIKDKIFQPFFTTKPTGQGTGLGLSLAYDIVKAHGGELKVESKEGEGSEFIIQLSNL